MRQPSRAATVKQEQRRASVAVILGASEFPEAPSLQPSDAFANSAGDFMQYLISPNGLGIPMSDICLIFDDDRSADDTDRAISQFLEKAKRRHPTGIDCVLFYYVGHGLFDNSRYCLALRSTRARSIGTSAYFWDDLARNIYANAKDALRIFIVDACFSGAAQPGGGGSIVMSDESALVEQQAGAVVLQQAGSALLCASSRFDFALAPVNKKYTMFSEGLLHALRTGDRSKPELLTLEDVRAAAVEHIATEYPDTSARPELHLPDQSRGAISNRPLFPNRAKLGENFGERFRRLEDYANTFNSRFDDVMGRVDALARSLEARKRSGGREAAIAGLKGDVKDLAAQFEIASTKQDKIGETLGALSDGIDNLKKWVDFQMPEYPLQDPRGVIVEASDQYARANIVGLLLIAAGTISATVGFYNYGGFLPFRQIVSYGQDRPWWLIINFGIAIFLLVGGLMSREKRVMDGLEPISDKERSLTRNIEGKILIRLFYAIPVKRVHVAVSVLVFVVSSVTVFLPLT